MKHSFTSLTLDLKSKISCKFSFVAVVVVDVVTTMLLYEVKEKSTRRKMVRGENTKRIDVLINKWKNKAVVLFKWFTKIFFSSDVKKFYTCRVLCYTDVYQETFSFKAYHIVLTTGLIEIPPQNIYI